MSGRDPRTDGSERNPNRASATWDQATARYLVSCAARRAPPGLAARLEEEWLADLRARSGAFSRIRFGLGCCWATRVIAREFGVAAAAAGSSPAGERLLVAHGGYDFSRFSRRTTALIVIVCLHLGIFYLYRVGFAPPLVSSSTPPINGGVINDPRKPHKPAPLPPVTLHTVVENFPTPVPRFNFPADPLTITETHLSNVRPVRSTPKPVNRVMGGPGAGFPDTADYYPPAARRLSETGAADVRVCVDPNGKLTAAPAIVQSSGIAQLDEGALRLARAGSGRYRPTIEDGRPVSSCYAFRIRFQLEDE